MTIDSPRRPDAQGTDDKATGDGEREDAVRRGETRIRMGERSIGGSCNQNDARNDSEGPAGTSHSPGGQSLTLRQLVDGPLIDIGH
jgi:hypothetical protein